MEILQYTILAKATGIARCILLGFGAFAANKNRSWQHSIGFQGQCIYQLDGFFKTVPIAEGISLHLFLS